MGETFHSRLRTVSPQLIHNLIPIVSSEKSLLLLVLRINSGWLLWLGMEERSPSADPSRAVKETISPTDSFPSTQKHIWNSFHIFRVICAGSRDSFLRSWNAKLFLSRNNFPTLRSLIKHVINCTKRHGSAAGGATRGKFGKFTSWNIWIKCQWEDLCVGRHFCALFCWNPSYFQFLPLCSRPPPEKSMTAWPQLVRSEHHTIESTANDPKIFHQTKNCSSWKKS